MKFSSQLGFAVLLGMVVPTSFAGSTATLPAGSVLESLHPTLPATATSLFAPLGYGPQWGSVYAAGAFVNRWPGGNKSDGYVLAGLGLGDADAFVGGSLTVLVDSLGLRNEGLGTNTGLSGALYRWLNQDTAISFGISNIVGSGALKHAAHGYYASITEILPLSPHTENPMPFTLTVGVGTGSLVSPSAFRIAQSDSKANVFGAASISPFSGLSIIVDYTSQILSTGASVAPLPNIPATVTFYASNLAGSRSLSGPVTYGVRVGIGYAFA
jgi:hypothetical protein